MESITRRFCKAFLAVAIVMVVACSGCGMEQKAMTQARDFCDRAVIGESLEALAKEARTTGKKVLRQVSKDKVSVGFVGIPPFSRHFCEIEAKDGIITKARYFHFD